MDDMFSLDDAQLLLLSTISYRLDRAGDVAAGDSVASICQGIRDNLLERLGRTDDDIEGNLSQQMTYREWLCVLDAIEGDQALCSLMVCDCTVDAAGAKLLMLSDRRGNGYAVFSGTGAGEWDDNAIAAYSEASLQQLDALAWIEKQVSFERFDQITACGHSKGGNKAMFLAVRAPMLVQRVVAFDAQGFSREFVRAQGDAILQNTQKITQYSLDNDYVNGLLSCIALPSRRIYIDGSHVSNPVAYHSPFSLFNSYRGHDGHTLVLGGEVPQGTFGAAFKGFSVYVQDTASPYEFRMLCSSVCDALENILTPHIEDDERAARAREMATGEGFQLLVKFLMGYFGELAKNETALSILTLLIPAGKRGKTIIDDFAIGALQGVSSLLKLLTR